MSALAINSLVGNHMSNMPSHDLAEASIKSSGSTIIDRKHYSAATGGNHLYSSHEHSGQSYGGHHGEKKPSKSHSIALTALTLLSFLFFLNILQQCLQDQMDEMNPQVVIMQARIKAIREAEAKATKEAEKRIGETPEKQNTVTKSSKEPSHTFKRVENQYQYEKVHVPVQIKSFDSRRP